MSKTNISSNTLNSRIRICLDLRGFNVSRKRAKQACGRVHSGGQSAWRRVSKRDYGDVRFLQINPKQSLELQECLGGASIRTSCSVCRVDKPVAMQQETMARARPSTKWGSRICGELGSHRQTCPPQHTAWANSAAWPSTRHKPPGTELVGCQAGKQNSRFESSSVSSQTSRTLWFKFGLQVWGFLECERVELG